MIAYNRSSAVATNSAGRGPRQNVSTWLAERERGLADWSNTVTTVTPVESESAVG